MSEHQTRLIINNRAEEYNVSENQSVVITSENQSLVITFDTIS